MFKLTLVGILLLHTYRWILHRSSLVYNLIDTLGSRCLRDWENLVNLVTEEVMVRECWKTQIDFATTSLAKV